ncbi:fumarylacetoacetate hydrolase family protein [Nocardioides sp. REDSEA-S30_B4]|jgi:2-keto-4-pentenoate hydratase/2-oxohepta-3-ene-1,7-dioic acid hydratase in catechol pathway|uniref:fumarylacetoacetate hydrolase family protein n=1 Tax=Nocardioides sp. REDSEA-S30_B4 TaxID=1811552 RepID=UPI000AE6B949|nr:fumarylacetoacetate hydrolase family protein [Nocardioides sp. REDSEA-S30_B4]
MSWSLVTYRTDLESRPRAGVLDAEGRVRRHPVLDGFDGLFEAVQEWDRLADALRSSDMTQGELVADAELLAPIRYPRKVMCAGANYPDHLREMGADQPSEGLRPYFFLVPPSTAIIGPGEQVRITEEDSIRPDYEAELAVVMGRRGKRIPAELAQDYVAGYTLFNDVTARGLLSRDMAVAPPFEFDWLNAKGGDSHCPTGPGLVPSWLVPDPHALSLRLWHNGKLKQDGHTSQMIFNIWELIAAASERVTLEPGDIIATGTPAGVGVAQGLALRGGDELVVEADLIGRLTSSVVVEDLIPAAPISRRS